MEIKNKLAEDVCGAPTRHDQRAERSVWAVLS